MSRGSTLVTGIAGLLLLVVALGACSREQTLRCGTDSIYLEARTAGALRVPDDLSVPDDSERLQIPEGGIAEADESADGCLEYSPAFRDVD